MPMKPCVEGREKFVRALVFQGRGIDKRLKPAVKAFTHKPNGSMLVLNKLDFSELSHLI